GTTVFYQHSRDHRAREHGQVAARCSRSKIGAGSARATSFSIHRHFALAEARPAVEAEIVGGLMTCRSRRAPDWIAAEATAVASLHRQGAIGAVQFARTSPAAFHFSKVGEHIGIAPA